MNQFNQKLDQARNRQKRFYLIAGMAVLAILFFVVALFIVSRGTRIEVLPGEAKEHAELRVIKGLGFGVGDTIYSLTGNPVIAVSAPGFKVATKTIDSGHLGKVFPLELLELPGHLVMEIANGEIPAKTSWRINGRDAALSTSLDLELEAGTYTVTIDNPFFQTKEMAVEIKRQEQMKLMVHLQPVVGVVNITSTPVGATIFLDEQAIGQTPLRFDQKGGRYTLRVAAEKYADIVEQLAITQATPVVTRNYRLEHRKAKVSLNLTPKGGTLLVNGIRMTEESLVLDATVQHHLSYMMPGYYSQTETISLTAGEEKEMSFLLMAETGEVEISSSPRAEVWVGGKNYGISPVSINLSAVVHEITFKKAGYRSTSRTVRPKGDRVQKVSVTLLTEYTARLQEAPREYSNTAGIKLKLFVINESFTMGAPRSEKGQRANEFQRDVNLTKPFYAGLLEVSKSEFAGFKTQQGQGTDNIPVTSVSWQEAAAFCNWLSEKEKLLPFYQITNNGKVTGFDTHSDGYRLLSEAEWEWLARKAGKTKQTIFTWGDDTVIPPKTTNVADESAKGQVRFYVPHYNDEYSGVAPVGSFMREASGLYDMAGNVSEWVNDVYSIVVSPANSRVNNPLGRLHGQAHVVKGANFRAGTITTLRPSFREGLSEGRDDVGFRIGRYLYGGEHE